MGLPAPYWEVLCEIREWTLELEAPAVDTTAVAEKFGNSVKSLVNGGGSTEFFIDRKCRDEGHGDGLDLLKLLMMTEKGCKAEANPRAAYFARRWSNANGFGCGFSGI